MSHKEPQYAELGRNIKIHRVRNQIVILSLIQQLRSAGFATYHQSHISDYENGQRRIPVAFLIGLARIGWDISSLFQNIKVFPPLDYFLLGVKMKELGIQVENFPNPFDAGFKFSSENP